MTFYNAMMQIISRRPRNRYDTSFVKFNFLYLSTAETYQPIIILTWADYYQNILDVSNYKTNICQKKSDKKIQDAKCNQKSI